MSNASREQIWVIFGTILRAVSAAILFYCLLWSVALFVGGLPVMVFVEAPSDNESLSVVGRVMPSWYPAALGYTCFSGLGLFGVYRRIMSVAWIGTGLLAAWSGLWLFSSGATVIPMVGLLVVVLLSVGLVDRKTERRRPN